MTAHDARAEAEKRLADAMYECYQRIPWDGFWKACAKLAAEEIARVWDARHMALNWRSDVPWEKVCADAEKGESTKEAPPSSTTPSSGG